MADDLDATIRDSAQGPAKASGDSGSMEQHPLPDQIAADRYRQAFYGAVRDASRLPYDEFMEALDAAEKDRWSFVVVRNHDMLRRIVEALPNGKMLADAPIGVVVCGDLNRAHDRQLSYLLQDCSAAIENLLLAASILGLGACWLGVHPREERMTHSCRRKNGVTVEPLERYDARERCWLEILVEDKHAGPAETATARIDFSAWLQRLPPRLRKIAMFLAAGETTTAAANRFQVSLARISQLRGKLHSSWQLFVGEKAIAA